MTELDEITKRLQSRLNNVTSTAFDDLEKEFDFLEAEMTENNGNNGNSVPTTSAVVSSVENRSSSQPQHSLPRSNPTLMESQRLPLLENQSTRATITTNHCNSVTTNDTNVSRSNPTNGCNKENSTKSSLGSKIEVNFQSTISLTNTSEDPIAGTRTHINHLLDKLSEQLTAPLPSYAPKKNIMDFLSTLRLNNNNFQNNGKCNRELITPPQCVSSQNVGNNVQPTESSETSESAGTSNESPIASENSHKISSIIREELVADDTNDQAECDDLTAHLMTSNVRHMDFNNILNPLFYEHLIPRLSDEGLPLNVDNQEASNGETIPEIDRLDNKYLESFKTMANNGISQAQSGSSSGSSSNQNTYTIDGKNEETASCSFLRETPPGVPVNANVNIHVHVKSSEDEATPSNCTDSTTTFSWEKSSARTNDGDVEENTSSSSSFESPTLTDLREAPEGCNSVEDTKKIANSKNDSSSTSTVDG